MITALLLLLSLSQALAHSWYDTDCCGDGDCFPVNCVEIVRAPSGDGWMYRGRWFSDDKLRSSKDGKCHVCYDQSVNRCIYLPGTS